MESNISRLPDVYLDNFEINLHNKECKLFRLLKRKFLMRKIVEKSYKLNKVGSNKLSKILYEINSKASSKTINVDPSRSSDLSQQPSLYRSPNRLNKTKEVKSMKGNDSDSDASGQKLLEKPLVYQDKTWQGLVRDECNADCDGSNTFTYNLRRIYKNALNKKPNTYSLEPCVLIGLETTIDYYLTLKQKERLLFDHFNTFCVGQKPFGRCRGFPVYIIIETVTEWKSIYPIMHDLSLYFDIDLLMQLKYENTIYPNRSIALPPNFVWIGRETAITLLKYLPHEKKSMLLEVLSFLCKSGLKRLRHFPHGVCETLVNIICTIEHAGIERMAISVLAIVAQIGPVKKELVRKNNAAVIETVLDIICGRQNVRDNTSQTVLAGLLARMTNRYDHEFCAYLIKGFDLTGLFSALISVSKPQMHLNLMTVFKNLLRHPQGYCTLTELEDFKYCIILYWYSSMNPKLQLAAYLLLETILRVSNIPPLIHRYFTWEFGTDVLIEQLHDVCDIDPQLSLQVLKLADHLSDSEVGKHSLINVGLATLWSIAHYSNPPKYKKLKGRVMEPVPEYPELRPGPLPRISISKKKKFRKNRKSLIDKNKNIGITSSKPRIHKDKNIGSTSSKTRSYKDKTIGSTTSKSRIHIVKKKKKKETFKNKKLIFYQDDDLRRRSNRIARPYAFPDLLKKPFKKQVKIMKPIKVKRGEKFNKFIVSRIKIPNPEPVEKNLTELTDDLSELSEKSKALVKEGYIKLTTERKRIKKEERPTKQRPFMKYGRRPRRYSRFYKVLKRRSRGLVRRRSRTKSQLTSTPILREHYDQQGTLKVLEMREGQVLQVSISGSSPFFTRPDNSSKYTIKKKILNWKNRTLSFSEFVNLCKPLSKCFVVKGHVTKNSSQTLPKRFTESEITKSLFPAFESNKYTMESEIDSECSKNYNIRERLILQLDEVTQKQKSYVSLANLSSKPQSCLNRKKNIIEFDGKVAKHKHYPRQSILKKKITLETHNYESSLKPQQQHCDGWQSVLEDLVKIEILNIIKSYVLNSKLTEFTVQRTLELTDQCLIRQKQNAELDTETIKDVEIDIAKTLKKQKTFKRSQNELTSKDSLHGSLFIKHPLNKAKTRYIVIRPVSGSQGSILSEEESETSATSILQKLAMDFTKDFILFKTQFQGKQFFETHETRHKIYPYINDFLNFRRSIFSLVINNVLKIQPLDRFRRSLKVLVSLLKFLPLREVNLIQHLGFSGALKELKRYSSSSSSVVSDRRTAFVGFRDPEWRSSPETSSTSLQDEYICEEELLRRLHSESKTDESCFHTFSSEAYEELLEDEMEINASQTTTRTDPAVQLHIYKLLKSREKTKERRLHRRQVRNNLKRITHESDSISCNSMDPTYYETANKKVTRKRYDEFDQPLEYFMFPPRITNKTRHLVLQLLCKLTHDTTSCKITSGMMQMVCPLVYSKPFARSAALCIMHLINNHPNMLRCTSTYDIMYYISAAMNKDVYEIQERSAIMGALNAILRRSNTSCRAITKESIRTNFIYWLLHTSPEYYKVHGCLYNLQNMFLISRFYNCRNYVFSNTIIRLLIDILETWYIEEVFRSYTCIILATTLFARKTYRKLECIDVINPFSDIMYTLKYSRPPSPTSEDSVQSSDDGSSNQDSSHPFAPPGTSPLIVRRLEQKLKAEPASINILTKNKHHKMRKRSNGRKHSKMNKNSMKKLRQQRKRRRLRTQRNRKLRLLRLLKKERGRSPFTDVLFQYLNTNIFATRNYNHGDNKYHFFLSFLLLLMFRTNPNLLSSFVSDNYEAWKSWVSAYGMSLDLGKRCFLASEKAIPTFTFYTQEALETRLDTRRVLFVSPYEKNDTISFYRNVQLHKEGILPTSSLYKISLKKRHYPHFKKTKKIFTRMYDTEAKSLIMPKFYPAVSPYSLFNNPNISDVHCFFYGPITRKKTLVPFWKAAEINPLDGSSFRKPMDSPRKEKPNVYNKLQRKTNVSQKKSKTMRTTRRPPKISTTIHQPEGIFVRKRKDTSRKEKSNRINKFKMKTSRTLLNISNMVNQSKGTSFRKSRDFPKKGILKLSHGLQRKTDSQKTSMIMRTSRTLPKISNMVNQSKGTSFRKSRDFPRNRILKLLHGLQRKTDPQKTSMIMRTSRTLLNISNMVNQSKGTSFRKSRDFPKKGILKLSHGLQRKTDSQKTSMIMRTSRTLPKISNMVNQSKGTSFRKSRDFPRNRILKLLHGLQRKTDPQKTSMIMRTSRTLPKFSNMVNQSKGTSFMKSRDFPKKGILKLSHGLQRKTNSQKTSMIMRTSRTLPKISNMVNQSKGTSFRKSRDFPKKGILKLSHGLQRKTNSQKTSMIMRTSRTLPKISNMVNQSKGTSFRKSRDFPEKGIIKLSHGLQRKTNSQKTSMIMRTSRTLPKISNMVNQSKGTSFRKSRDFPKKGILKLSHGLQRKTNSQKTSMIMRTSRTLPKISNMVNQSKGTSFRKSRDFPKKGIINVLLLHGLQKTPTISEENNKASQGFPAISTIMNTFQSGILGAPKDPAFLTCLTLFFSYVLYFELMQVYAYYALRFLNQATSYFIYDSTPIDSPFKYVSSSVDIYREQLHETSSLHLLRGICLNDFGLHILNKNVSRHSMRVGSSFGYIKNAFRLFTHPHIKRAENKYNVVRSQPFCTPLATYHRNIFAKFLPKVSSYLVKRKSINEYLVNNYCKNSRLGNHFFDVNKPSCTFWNNREGICYISFLLTFFKYNGLNKTQNSSEPLKIDIPHDFNVLDSYSVLREYFEDIDEHVGFEELEFDFCKPQAKIYEVCYNTGKNLTKSMLESFTNLVRNNSCIKDWLLKSYLPKLGNFFKLLLKLIKLVKFKKEKKQYEEFYSSESLPHSFKNLKFSTSMSFEEALQEEEDRKNLNGEDKEVQFSKNKENDELPEERLSEEESTSSASSSSSEILNLLPTIPIFGKAFSAPVASSFGSKFLGRYKNAVSHFQGVDFIQYHFPKKIHLNISKNKILGASKLEKESEVESDQQSAEETDLEYLAGFEVESRHIKQIYGLSDVIPDKEYKFQQYKSFLKPPKNDIKKQTEKSGLASTDGFVITDSNKSSKYQLSHRTVLNSTSKTSNFNEFSSNSKSCLETKYSKEDSEGRSQSSFSLKLISPPLSSLSSENSRTSSSTLFSLSSTLSGEGPTTKLLPIISDENLTYLTSQLSSNMFKKSNFSSGSESCLEPTYSKEDTEGRSQSSFSLKLISPPLSSLSSENSRTSPSTLFSLSSTLSGEGLSSTSKTTSNLNEFSSNSKSCLEPTYSKEDSEGRSQSSFSLKLISPPLSSLSSENSRTSPSTLFSLSSTLSGEGSTTKLLPIISDENLTYLTSQLSSNMFKKSNFSSGSESCLEPTYSKEDSEGRSQSSFSLKLISPPLSSLSSENSRTSPSTLFSLSSSLSGEGLSSTSKTTSNLNEFSSNSKSCLEPTYSKEDSEGRSQSSFSLKLISPPLSSLSSENSRTSPSTFFSLSSSLSGEGSTTKLLPIISDVNLTYLTSQLSSNMFKKSNFSSGSESRFRSDNSVRVPRQSVDRRSTISSTTSRQSRRRSSLRRFSLAGKTLSSLYAKIASTTDLLPRTTTVNPSLAYLKSVFVSDTFIKYKKLNFLHNYLTIGSSLVPKVSYNNEKSNESVVSENSNESNSYDESSSSISLESELFVHRPDSYLSFIYQNLSFVESDHYNLLSHLITQDAENYDTEYGVSESEFVNSEEHYYPFKRVYYESTCDCYKLFDVLRDSIESEDDESSLLESSQDSSTDESVSTESLDSDLSLNLSSYLSEEAEESPFIFSDETYVSEPPPELINKKRRRSSRRSKSFRDEINDIRSEICLMFDAIRIHILDLFYMPLENLLICPADLNIPTLTNVMLEFFTECNSSLNSSSNLPKLYNKNIKSNTYPPYYRRLLAEPFASVLNLSIYDSYREEPQITHSIRKIPEVLKYQAIDRTIQESLYCLLRPEIISSLVAETKICHFHDSKLNPNYIIQSYYKAIRLNNLDMNNFVNIQANSREEFMNQIDIKRKRKISKKKRFNKKSRKRPKKTLFSDEASNFNLFVIGVIRTFIKILYSSPSCKEFYRQVLYYLGYVICRRFEGPFGYASSHLMYCHRRALEKVIGSSIISIGKLRIGSHLEKAIVFKYLADYLMIPCRIYRAGNLLTWIEVPVRPHRLGEESSYVVDLHEKPGCLDHKDMNKVIKLFGYQDEPPKSEDNDNIIPEIELWLDEQGPDPSYLAYAMEESLRRKKVLRTLKSNNKFVDVSGTAENSVYYNVKQNSGNNEYESFSNVKELNESLKRDKVLKWLKSNNKFVDVSGTAENSVYYNVKQNSGNNEYESFSNVKELNESLKRDKVLKWLKSNNKFVDVSGTAENSVYYNVKQNSGNNEYESFSNVKELNESLKRDKVLKWLKSNNKFVDVSGTAENSVYYNVKQNSGNNEYESFSNVKELNESLKRDKVLKWLKSNNKFVDVSGTAENSVYYNVKQNSGNNEYESFSNVKELNESLKRDKVLKWLKSNNKFVDVSGTAENSVYYNVKQNSGNNEYESFSNVKELNESLKRDKVLKWLKSNNKFVDVSGTAENSVYYNVKQNSRNDEMTQTNNKLQRGSLRNVLITNLNAKSTKEEYDEDSSEWSEDELYVKKKKKLEQFNTKPRRLTERIDLDISGWDIYEPEAINGVSLSESNSSMVIAKETENELSTYSLSSGTSSDSDSSTLSDSNIIQPSNLSKGLKRKKVCFWNRFLTSHSRYCVDQCEMSKVTDKTAWGTVRIFDDSSSEVELYTTSSQENLIYEWNEERSWSEVSSEYICSQEEDKGEKGNICTSILKKIPLNTLGRNMNEMSRKSPDFPPLPFKSKLNTKKRPRKDFPDSEKDFSTQEDLINNLHNLARKSRLVKRIKSDSGPKSVKRSKCCDKKWIRFIFPDCKEVFDVCLDFTRKIMGNDPKPLIETTKNEVIDSPEMVKLKSDKHQSECLSDLEVNKKLITNIFHRFNPKKHRLYDLFEEISNHYDLHSNSVSKWLPEQE